MRTLHELLFNDARIRSRSISVVGADKRTAFSHALIGAGCPKPAVVCALHEHPSRFSVGAARNVALLLYAGRPIIMLDDDVLWRFYGRHKTEPGTWLFGHGCPYSLDFVASRQEALEFPNIRRTCPDIRANLGSILGRGLQHDGIDLNFDYACDHQLEAILRGTAIVGVAQFGIIGDSAMYTGDWTALHGQRTLHRLCGSDSLFRISRSSREIVNLPDRGYISHEPVCMTVAAALANEEMLPPFMPHFRNEDGVFAALLGLCNPSVFFCHVPHAVLHMANPGRPYLKGGIIRVSDLVLQAIFEMSGGLTSDPEVNYKLLGRSLYDTQTKAKVAKETLTRWWTGACASKLQMIDHLRNSATMDSSFCAHLKSLEEQVIGNLRNPLAAIADLNPESSATDLSLFLAEFGEVLMNWGDMRAASSMLRN